MTSPGDPLSPSSPVYVYVYKCINVWVHVYVCMFLNVNVYRQAIQST